MYVVGMDDNEKQLDCRCPLCGEPVGNEHPDADVYHLACLMAATEHLRERKGNE